MRQGYVDDLQLKPHQSLDTWLRSFRHFVNDPAAIKQGEIPGCWREAVAQGLIWAAGVYVFFSFIFIWHWYASIFGQEYLCPISASNVYLLYVLINTVCLSVNSPNLFPHIRMSHVVYICICFWAERSCLIDWFTRNYRDYSLCSKKLLWVRA